MGKHPAHIFVIDDGVISRQVLTEILESEFGSGVALAFANFDMANKKADRQEPRLVLFSYSGKNEDDILESLKALKKAHPKISMVLLYEENQTLSEISKKLMKVGVTTFIEKSPQLRMNEETRDMLRRNFIPEIRRCLASWEGNHDPNGENCPIERDHEKRRNRKLDLNRSKEPIGMILVASSTGGPQALECVFSKISNDIHVPILVVQHMPEEYVDDFVDKLNRISSLPVIKGKHGMIVEKGKVYFAAGGYHLKLAKNGDHHILELTNEPPVNSCRPSADVLFNSVANEWTKNVLICVLTGMGRDGFKGTQLLKSHGAVVFVQDQESSAVWGMPGTIAENGLADRIVSIQDMAEEINELLVDQNLVEKIMKVDK